MDNILDNIDNKHRQQHRQQITNLKKLVCRVINTFYLRIVEVNMCQSKSTLKKYTLFGWYDRKIFKTTITTKTGKWKGQVTLVIRFVSLDDMDNKGGPYSKSDLKIMAGVKIFHIIREHIGSVIIRYQDGLDELMNDSNFVSDSIGLTRNKLHKIGLKSCKWIFLICSNSCIKSKNVVKFSNNKHTQTG